MHVMKDQIADDGGGKQAGKSEDVRDSVDVFVGGKEGGQALGEGRSSAETGR